MITPENVILVPGFDAESLDREQIPALWLKEHKLHVEIHPIIWTDTNYEEVFEAIEERIREIGAGALTLVADSAGASAILNLYARHPNIHAVATVCGKINHPELIGPATLETYPNFAASMALLPASLEDIYPEMRGRVLCAYSNQDGVVRDPRDAVLAGSNELLLPVKGHIPSITHAYITESEPIAGFIKQ